MKGAIGNALIMNIVITFVILFFTLLIGSMAYSKAYKTKNYLISMIDEEARTGNFYFEENLGHKLENWDNKVNDYLRQVGYPLSTSQYGNCPEREGYINIINNKQGRYNYCIYRRGIIFDTTNDPVIRRQFNYMVLVYMKFDLPVVGGLIKIPVTGETKAYSIYR